MFYTVKIVGEVPVSRYEEFPRLVALLAREAVKVDGYYILYIILQPPNEKKLQKRSRLLAISDSNLHGWPTLPFLSSIDFMRIILLW